MHYLYKWINISFANKLNILTACVYCCLWVCRKTKNALSPQRAGTCHSQITGVTGCGNHLLLYGPSILLNIKNNPKYPHRALKTYILVATLHYNSGNEEYNGQQSLIFHHHYKSEAGSMNDYYDLKFYISSLSLSLLG